MECVRTPNMRACCMSTLFPCFLLFFLPLAIELSLHLARVSVANPETETSRSSGDDDDKDAAEDSRQPSVEGLPSPSRPVAPAGYIKTGEGGRGGEVPCVMIYENKVVLASSR